VKNRICIAAGALLVTACQVVLLLGAAYSLTALRL
jgi:hypothetical protein